MSTQIYKGTLFILEDNPGPANIIPILENRGYNVERAKSLLEAIFMLELNPNKKTYDAIILDLQIPGLEWKTPKTNVIRKYMDYKSLNGYLYYKEQIDNTLAQYKGRIALYSAFPQQFKERAMEDGIDANDIIFFDKLTKDLHIYILKWLNDLHELKLQGGIS